MKLWGDGVHDDTVALQALWNQRRFPPPPATYLVTGPLWIDNVILGSHPRKGDRGWGMSGKPLQGRRYRQACRKWNRTNKGRRS